MNDLILLTTILPISLGIIMFGMGLSLMPKDFKRVFEFPKATIIGVCNQIIVLPIIAFLLAIMFNTSSEIAIGLIIIAVCPGGPTSNLITHVSKGDVALSIMLTAITSIITVFTIPFIISFALNFFGSGIEKNIEISFLDVIIKLAFITILPVSIGMLLKRIKPELAKLLEKPMRIVSVIIFTAIVLGIVLVNKDNLLFFGKQAGIITFLLNISCMAVGYFSARLFKLNKTRSITIMIESGIQNGTLAIVIASSILMQPSMSIPGAVYAILMYFSSAFLMWYYNKK